jgi:DNA primase
MPGMKKTQLLYNFDHAKQHPYVVVVEGVTDVWAFGPEAVALFGKTIAQPQADLIAQTWQKVYVILDADAITDAQAVHAALRGRVPEVIVVQLPKNQDPGSLPTATLRDLVLNAPIEQ